MLARVYGSVLTPLAQRYPFYKVKLFVVYDDTTSRPLYKMEDVFVCLCKADEREHRPQALVFLIIIRAPVFGMKLDHNIALLIGRNFQALSQV